MIVDGFVGQTLYQPEPQRPVRFARLRQFFADYEQAFSNIGLVLIGGLAGAIIGTLLVGSPQPQVVEFTIKVPEGHVLTPETDSIVNASMTFCGFGADPNGAPDFGRLQFNASWYELPDGTSLTNLESIKDLKVNEVYVVGVDPYGEQIVSIDGVELPQAPSDYTCPTPTTV